MSMKRKWLQSSMFIRQLSTFLVVMIPIYALSLALFSTGIGMIRSRITDSMDYQVEVFLGSLEEDIAGIRTNIYNCYGDNNLNALAYSPSSLGDYARVKAMRDLIQRLFAIENSQPYVSDVSVHLRDIGKTLVSSGRIDDISSDAYAVLADMSQNKTLPVRYSDDTLVMVDTFSYHKAAEGHMPGYIFHVRLSDREIAHALDMMNAKSDGGVFLYSRNGSFSRSTGADPDAIARVRSLESGLAGRNDQGGFTFKIGTRTYHAIAKTSSFLDMTLVRYVSADEFLKPMNTYMVLFWAFLGVGLIIIVLYSFSMFRSVHRPLNQLVHAFQRMQEGDLSIAIASQDRSEFGYIFQSFNTMVENLKDLIESITEQKVLLQKAKVRQLQAQINPHFLYNSFFILKSRIENEDNEGAKDFCDQLGKYFQFVTHIDRDEILFTEELEHARIYTNLQSVRFGKRIQVAFAEIPKSLVDFQVPRIIIQPLLENAYKYGLENRREKGLVRVGLMISSGLVQVVVEDNGCGMQAEALAKLNGKLSGKGRDEEMNALGNIHWRLKLRFGGESGLCLDTSELGGVKVVLTIDLKGGATGVQFADRG